MKTPIIIHIPHASTYIPKDIRKTFLIDEDKLLHELQIMTDHFCDNIFDYNCPKIIAPISRLVCDMERFRNDNEESMASVGMSAVYTRCSNGAPLRKDDSDHREHILRKYYDPHHEHLTNAVKNTLEIYNKCLIIDGHSFHPTPLPHEPSRSPHRPDICIGTDPFHTPQHLIRETLHFFQNEGLSVNENMPFAGTIVPIPYYHKDSRVASIMIEINRKLYTDKNGNISADYNKIKTLIHTYLKKIENDLILPIFQ